MFSNQILEYSAKSSGVEVRDGSAGGSDEAEEPETDADDAESVGRDGEEEEEEEEEGRIVEEYSELEEVS